MTTNHLEEIKEHLRRTIQRRIIDDLVRSDSISRVKEIRALNSVYFHLWGKILDPFELRAMIRIRHLEIQKRINWNEYLN